MPEPRRRSRTLLAVLVLVSLILITVDYRQGDGGAVAAIQRGALAVFGPVAEGFATVVRPVGGFFSAVGELGSLRERNAALESDLQELRRQQVHMADVERENAELRAQFDMRQRLGFTTTVGRVIAQPPTSVERSVLLDVGANNGLLPGMAVINEFGLVGKLTEVTAGNARVELLTSPNARYGVRLAETGEQGFLTGRGANPFQLELLDTEAEIEAGAQVVTQLFTGTAIPDGIPVGVIEAPRDASRFLAVRPYVDFTRLTTVQVVLDYPTQPTELPEEERLPSPDLPRPDLDDEP
ncbi:MAG TPA: rod shape-determining protein MreC [Egibacteraceae bacterium]|nr:rod shape-determining protein MreC [Egibacteraceae bacterium]